MPQLTDTQLQELLVNIEDPNLRAQYEALANSSDTAIVYCLSKTCKGREIGRLNNIGVWVGTNATKKSGLLSTRQRFDGHTGFYCRCGNKSIVSAAEDGIITTEAPTRNDLAQIYVNQQKSPADVTEHLDGSVSVDGFKVAPIRSIA